MTKFHLKCRVSCTYTIFLFYGKRSRVYYFDSKRKATSWVNFLSTCIHIALCICVLVVWRPFVGVRTTTHFKHLCVYAVNAIRLPPSISVKICRKLLTWFWTRFSASAHTHMPIAIYGMCLWTSIARPCSQYILDGIRWNSISFVRMRIMSIELPSTTYKTIKCNWLQVYRIHTQYIIVNDIFRLLIIELIFWANKMRIWLITSPIYINCGSEISRRKHK